MPEPLLDVRDLRVRFRTRQGPVTAVDGLSFRVGPGEVLGVVGESGSGKSVSMLAVLRLLTSPNVTVSGEVRFRGRDLLTLSDKEMRAVRGREIAMVFQDPMTALTPVYTVGWQIAEQIRAHEQVSRKEARARAVRLLSDVGIPDAASRVNAYPHEFSGGMRQRAVIAMALSCNPSLLIADEPTTALDVTVQAQILDLMRDLNAQGSAMVLITHDMGVVSQIADRVLVMYGGRAAEQGPRRAVFHGPRHPYTWGLLDSVPRVGGARLWRLPTIAGTPVSPGAVPEGCAFAPRCRLRHERCEERPALTAGGGNAAHLDACWLPPDDRAGLRLTSDEDVNTEAVS
ncbi:MULTISPECIES: oligopeptide/dipeptide ABC transporter ATP-binding protein [Streptomyces]|uniref:D-methionine ABC transporter, ATP-binding protein n=1 Tax=Streptomyces sviceus (strain ATCC 29083 / DSM 924 / JCM 4929 / NBRC 13980 / NCIMB 11184 / NRRL 5439 / UC 5370) TaxID=463191 RepID=D6XCB3_STRX2|nr:MULTISPECIES: oligopeptide/dipeptide ABC transporter ATP-binding protein [Streptomyces]EFH28375.1 D-methionine ABC transporter, ATP-binding protein [Streptomyces sviceus ATCC 29083]MYT03987.1 ATP-binding cassette domain-containing protein [Streptomyces sp. SID5470]